jgi:hypothetical protein
MLLAEKAKQKKNLLDNKLEYLKLAYTISIIRLLGGEPPKKLIEKAKIARILANYSKEELENL